MSKSWYLYEYLISIIYHHCRTDIDFPADLEDNRFSMWCAHPSLSSSRALPIFLPLPNLRQQLSGVSRLSVLCYVSPCH